MANIVVTGSTRGIGLGLVQEFHSRGNGVMVVGRDQTRIEPVVRHFGEERAAGFACDVTDPEQVRGLWHAASERFGRVDHWINNAGMTTSRHPLWNQPDDEIKATVDTNLLGSLYGSKTAIQGMWHQGGGVVWNFEGFGSDGRVGEGMVTYGSTKSAITYLHKSLAADTKNSPVDVGVLSPGIVVTDLLTDGYEIPSPEWDKAKKILTILGDRVETVVPFLVKGVLESKGSDRSVKWLTNRKAATRFMNPKYKKRDLFSDVEAAARSGS